MFQLVNQGALRGGPNDARDGVVVRLTGIEQNLRITVLLEEIPKVLDARPVFSQASYQSLLLERGGGPGA